MLKKALILKKNAENFPKMEIVRTCQLCEASREKEDSIQIFYRKKKNVN
jgi:hypothetical protein